jgi:lipid II:glycine glycyltransferase (peptidoglycan interpeptide bridge formation enzyme)
MGMTDISKGENVPATIFSQPWWLDAVAPDSWDAIKIEKGGQIFARLPYVIKRKYGLTMLTMPKLTQTLGPWLRPYPGKYANKLSEEKELMDELIDRLPQFDVFKQNFHYSIVNWLPFYWSGFEQTTRYTYVIKSLIDLDQVWNEFDSNTRKRIRKAKKEVFVHNDHSVNEFLDLNEMTFQRQDLSLPYSRDFVRRIDKACVEHNCRKMFFAKDHKGRLHAAIYLVWDDQSAYYLMGGSDPNLRNSGAMSLLMWEAIQYAATVTNTFDFEGSMIESVERHFRSFGAKQKRYFQVTKINSLPLKAYRDIRSWLKVL